MNEESGTASQEGNHIAGAKQEIIVAMGFEQRDLLPHGQRQRRGQDDVPCARREDHVLSERGRRVDPDVPEWMVHSSHAAQYGLDTPTYPRALAHQTYAINPKDQGAASSLREPAGGRLPPRG